MVSPAIRVLAEPVQDAKKILDALLILPSGGK
jgi:hypothetical protein